MPVYYSYDQKKNVVHSYAMCNCGSSEFVENMKNIANSNDIHDGFVELVDLERMNGLDVSSGEMENLKEAFTECKKKGCKRIIFFQPNPGRQDMKMVRALKSLMTNALPDKDNLLVFTRSHKRLQKLMTV